MAIILRQGAPVVDYYSLSTQLPESDSSISPSDVWDLDRSFDSTLTGFDSCDSSLATPTKSGNSIFPSQTYGIAEKEFEGDVKSDKTFDFGSFEDWMRWDDPSDIALSPESEIAPELETDYLSSGVQYPELGIAGRSTMNVNKRDNSVEFSREPISEEQLFQSSESQDSPRQGLYSTPLSWSPPLPGSEPTVTDGRPYLTPQQEARLRDIAMPPSRFKSEPQCPGSPSPDELSADNLRKRKSNVEEENDEDSTLTIDSNGQHLPVKKTAHNMIEKRYRTNLNDKIAALRDSVPSLRVMSKKESRSEETQEDLHGLTPAHKLNKGTVLSKATEYIAHLEKRNKYLTRENASLKSRIDAFEILIMSRQDAPSPTGNQLAASVSGRPREAGYRI